MIKHIPTRAERQELLKCALVPHSDLIKIEVQERSLTKAHNAAQKALADDKADVRDWGHAKQLVGALLSLATDEAILIESFNQCAAETIAQDLQRYYHSLWMVCNEYALLTGENLF